jgi:hypothetical protein
LDQILNAPGGYRTTLQTGDPRDLVAYRMAASRKSPVGGGSQLRRRDRCAGRQAPACQMSYASCLPCALLQCSRIAADPCRGPVRDGGLPARSAPSRQGRRGANERAEPAFFPHAVRVLQPVAAGSHRRGAMVPLTRKRPAQSRFPTSSKVAPVGTGLPIVVTLARRIIVERRWSTAICPSPSEGDR